jgi:hypothetical protein
MERAVDGPFGPKLKAGNVSYIQDVITDFKSLKRFLSVEKNLGNKMYPNMLKGVLASGRVKEISGINNSDQYLPGYENDKKVKIQILGPYPEKIGDTLCLRWFESDGGKTKNGHSVICKLMYDNVKILLGGDLNIPAEKHLLKMHTGIDPDSKSPADRENLTARARAIFESDIAKACHHGSADFTNLFLSAINPMATIISSGDNESHSHPRPDALGAFGKFSRGDRPLIFSTELARSSSEKIKNPFKLRQEIVDLYSKKDKATEQTTKDKIQKKIDSTLSILERSVAVYGLINLRTDGKKVVIAQKLEAPRDATGEEWDIYRLEPVDGMLQFISKIKD